MKLYLLLSICLLCDFFLGDQQPKKENSKAHEGCKHAHLVH